MLGAKPSRAEPKPVRTWAAIAEEPRLERFGRSFSQLACKDQEQNRGHNREGKVKGFQQISTLVTAGPDEVRIVPGPSLSEGAIQTAGEMPCQNPVFPQQISG
jgi:hypothetical protein